MDMDLPVVVVTGASGYVASHVIIALLATGRYRVRGTLRSAANSANLTHFPGGAVEYFEANLMSDQGWEAAMKGASYLLHVASPFPIGKVAPDSLCQPAVEGTERVLRAAAASGTRQQLRDGGRSLIFVGGRSHDLPNRAARIVQVPYKQASPVWYAQGVPLYSVRTRSRNSHAQVLCPHAEL